MKPLQKFLTALLIGLLTTAATGAQAAGGADTTTVIAFRFRHGSDRFMLRGNEAELTWLLSLVDACRSGIAAGRLPVYVDGYCTSLPGAEENLRTAGIRANRVKSELIVRKGLKEADFVTAVHASAWEGCGDAVVVTLRIPGEEVAEPPAEVIPPSEPAAPKDPEPAAAEQPEPQPGAMPESAAATDPQPEVATPATSAAPAKAAKPYCLALRTNLLYDALLLPTLGIEWRINPEVGIRLDASRSWWGGKNGKVQKVWLLSPEVRCYLLRDRRFYLGAAGNYGEYNIYKYPLGSLLKDGTGYQGRMWSAGVSVGYQLRLSRHLSADFNLGLGYTRFDYDTFGIDGGARVGKQRDKQKNFWGPTQAGITLVWTVGGNK